MNTPVSSFKSKVGTDPACMDIPPSPFLQRLGCGTGVSVYLVERSPRNGILQSPWAVKKVNCNRFSEQNDIYTERLKEEASILKNLHHKNIVGFRGIVKARDGMLCLALEDAEKCLYSMIEEQRENEMGSFLPIQIRKVACDVASALSYLHNEKKLLHGDIKSGNILIKGNFEIAKLCDFGVTVKLDENLSADSSCYVGTEAWSAKEVRTGKRITDRTDIYAYGIVIFEMMTLSIPHFDVFPEEEDFDNEEEYEQSFEKAEELYQSLLGSRPSLPASLGKSYQSTIELFYVCTCEKPEKRPSANQIVASLPIMFSATDLKCKLQFDDLDSSNKIRTGN